MFDYITIIFLALAVFIFLRLRSVLGQRTGRERPPINPYAARDVSTAPSDKVDDYIKSDSLDVLQPDIRAFGLTLQWELSRKMADHPNIKLAPHNWGSHLGLHMQLVLARGIPNFLMAEQDTATSDLWMSSRLAWICWRCSSVSAMAPLGSD